MPNAASFPKDKSKMRSIRYIALFLLVAFTGLGVSPLSAQEGVYRIIDFVEVPAKLSHVGDSACFIKFREQWTFPDNGSLSKEVTGFDFECSRDISLPPGVTRIQNISYEFMLLDPHLVESQNKAFSGPDSMDLYTRNLQADLIQLIQRLAPISLRYNPREQLLSVYFHEEWTLAPDSMGLSKKVKAITPVIWQRRQTTEGEGVDDGDTGLPVYYKTPLQKIALRQP